LNARPNGHANGGIVNNVSDLIIVYSGVGDFRSIEAFLVFVVLPPAGGLVQQRNMGKIGLIISVIKMKMADIVLAEFIKETITETKKRRKYNGLQ
jgi:hypothetical protein